MIKSGLLVANLGKKDLDEYLNYINSIPFVKRDSLNLPKDLTFGCEIEVDKIPFSNANGIVSYYNAIFKNMDPYSCFEDGSVDSEFITPICRDCEAEWNRMDFILNDLKNRGAKISGRTSGHVHIGTHGIDSKEKLGNLVKILCVFEPLFFRFGYGFKNNAEYFHYCWPQINRSTYTRVMDPQDVDKFMKFLENKNASDYDFCRAYLNFLHCEVFTRPVFNFRNFDYEKLVNFLAVDKANNDLYHQNIISTVFPRGDHLEVRCFSGTLDTTIWQNNVDLILRVIYAVANNLVDMDYIDYHFARYRRNRYIFYKNLQDYSCQNCLEKHAEYNAFVDSYSDCNPDMALWFADQFYTIFSEDEIAKEYFLKQYFKLFGKDSLKLKKEIMGS